ncbi:MAG: hypothetical protein HFH62_13170 [Lachnospiraceae bacterium]|nr:hypothetical protein [Lachnospiraceae bacterium]
MAKYERTAVFLFYMILVITPAVTVHGKTGFTDGDTDGKNLRVRKDLGLNTG